MNQETKQRLLEELDQLIKDLRVFSSLFPYERSYVLRRCNEIIAEYREHKLGSLTIPEIGFILSSMDSLTPRQSSLD